MILVKQCDSIQIAHLYEHLFCASIDSLFSDSTLFPRLDYSLVGETYKGLVYIDLELYTEKATRVSKKIHALDIALDEETIITTASQLLAEKELLFGSLGYEEIRQELGELHQRPWQDIDDLELIDTKDAGQKLGALYVIKDKPLPAQKLTVRIVLDPDFAGLHRELHPLFRELTLLLAESSQIVICNAYGYYSFELDNKSTTDVIQLSHVFSVPYGEEADADLVLALYLDVIRNLQKSVAIKRLASELSGVSHNTHPIRMPNLVHIFEDTHIFIGAKGWKKIATYENCELLLQHMSVEIQYDDDIVKERVSVLEVK